MLEAIEYLIEKHDLHRPSVLLGIVQMSEEELVELEGIDLSDDACNDNAHRDFLELPKSPAPDPTEDTHTDSDQHDGER